MSNSRTWQPTKLAECSVCNDIPAMICACGAQRCERCLAPKVAVDAPDCSWLQSADRPAPFYVVDSQKLSSGEKLLWLRQELGSDASLEDFAVKFIELFGSKLRGKIPQKKAVLKLYALCTETDIAAKESQLAPPVGKERTEPL